MKDLFELDVRRRPWRPAQVIDVTLRDGGFRNRFAWSLDDMVTVARCASAAGADCIELGYLGGIPELHDTPDAGPTARLTPADIAWVRERAGTARLCAMVHPSGAGDSLRFADYRAVGLELVRLVYHESWDGLFFRLAAEAAAAGLKTSANLALASRYPVAELLDKARRAAAAGIDLIYLADTCAALLPAEVEALTRELVGLAPIGFHAHDFLSLALANALAATAAGATWVDASICGVGRGAGNLRLELWLALAHACTGTGATLSALVPALQMIEAQMGAPTLPDLASIVAGALNLTPPQEGQLRARAGGVSVTEAAATLLDNHGRATTVGGAFDDRDAR